MFQRWLKIHNRSGFSHSIGKSIYSHRHRNPASAYTTELQAICNCLQHILTLPPQSITNTFIIVPDSLVSLNPISPPSTSRPLISRIRIHLNTWIIASISIVFVKAPGHAGIPSNERVDKAQNKPLTLHPFPIHFHQPTPTFSNTSTTSSAISSSQNGKIYTLEATN